MVNSWSYENTGISLLWYINESTDTGPQQLEREMHCNNWMKCSVEKYHVRFEVANVVRQSCSLHSTYHWVCWHFVLPVVCFRWADTLCRLSWIALRNKIQFRIFRGVPLQSALPSRYHFDEEIVFLLSCDTDLLQFLNPRLTIFLDTTSYFFFFSFQWALITEEQTEKKEFFGSLWFLTQNNNCFGIRRCQLHAQR